MKIALLRAVRTIAALDSLPARVAAFEDLSKEKLLIRTIYTLYCKIHPHSLRAIAMGVYALGAFAKIECIESWRSKIVGISIYDNERREVEIMAKLLAPYKLVKCNPSIKAIFRSRTISAIVKLLVSPRKVRKFLRVLKHYTHKKHFFTCCRIASTLGSYARLKIEMSREHPHAILSASWASPESTAFSAAAHGLGIPSIYSAHSIVAPSFGQFAPSYDLLLLYGQSSLDSLEERTIASSQFLLKGLDGPNVPLRVQNFLIERLTFGIFLSPLTNVEVLEELISAIVIRFAPAQVLVRPHPNPIFASDVIHLEGKFHDLTVVQGMDLRRNVESCSIVFAGNSNVHLDIIKRGVPSVFYSGLDLIEDDILKLVENGVVPRIDSLDLLTPTFLTEFFSGDWTERIKYYDEAYLEDPHVRSSRINKELVQFLRARQSSAARQK